MLQNFLLVISGLVVLGYLVGVAAAFAILPALCKCNLSVSQDIAFHAPTNNLSLQVTMIACLQLAKRMRPAQKIWNSAVDTRLTTTTDALTNLISVKMTGLVNVVSKSLDNLMVDEMEASKTARLLMTSTYIIGTSLEIQVTTYHVITQPLKLTLVAL